MIISSVLLVPHLSSWSFHVSASQDFSAIILR